MCGDMDRVVLPVLWQEHIITVQVETTVGDIRKVCLIVMTHPLEDTRHGQTVATQELKIQLYF